MIELSLNILDIIQNSVVAGAKVIEVNLAEKDGIFSFGILDDGCGMPAEFLKKVTDPFTTTRTTRKVGFGLPLVRQLCEMSGGDFFIESEPGAGTFLLARFQLDNIDRPPLGDISGTMLTTLISNPQCEFVFRYAVNELEYELDTREIKEVLDGVPLSDPDVIAWLRDNLTEGLGELEPKA